MTTSPELQLRAVNTIRTLSIDAVQKANSGHPGLPMGAAPMAYTLWTRHLRHNPGNPKWADRDRFVLSAGHGSMLLYSLLHLTGYDLSLDDIKNFRQYHSKTPGHPENHMTPGVETTTGPLGQGAANSIGMALAESILAAYFNRDGHTIVNHYTYALVGDGDLMEGVCMEASALAGHWGLGKLIWLYDANDITLDGPANIAFTENIAARYEAWGWHVSTVRDGNDIDAIDAAIKDAQARSEQPSIIIVKTIIGYGSPNKAGTSKAHGSPLGAEEVALTKKALGWPAETFHIPGDVLEHFREAQDDGTESEDAWQAKFDDWRSEFPELASEWDTLMRGALPTGWDRDIPTFSAGKAVATRNASGDVLNAIAKHLPTFVGGDADLAGSTKTLIKGAEDTAHGKPAARNIRFGVREHGMGSIVNGLALHGGIVRPYSATFLTFSDYMRGAIRLGALMKLHCLYIFTHDSIGLGEDGPTHQPVEHVMALRAIPNLFVFRPADANETAVAWKTSMTVDGPAVLCFTRQDLPVIGDRERVDAGVPRGAYTLIDSAGTPDVLILATGSEVAIAVDAHTLLTEAGVKARVVSMPCWELFEAQDATYKESVLPAAVTKRVSIEAGITLGWHKFVGLNGTAIGVDHFGESAPFEILYDKYGLTAANVAAQAQKLLRS
ncbi:MAG: transketolase [Anaerolineae bacterium]|nr:transketolase [Chloroflexota bacterium]MBP6298272.1 transketolase [Anaerolineae bacterium]